MLAVFTVASHFARRGVQPLNSGLLKALKLILKLHIPAGQHLIDVRTPMFTLVKKLPPTACLSPNTLQFPSAGSAGGCRRIKSAGTSGIRMTEASSTPCCSACILRSSSTRASFSGLKSCQNGGGRGNVEETFDGSSCWSAIVTAPASWFQNLV